MSKEAVERLNRYHQVVAALQSPEHLWRTVRGIAAETGLSIVEVEAGLWAARAIVISHPAGSVSGEELFTTRSHYRKKATRWARFAAGVRGAAA